MLDVELGGPVDQCFMSNSSLNFGIWREGGREDYELYGMKQF